MALALAVNRLREKFKSLQSGRNVIPVQWWPPRSLPAAKAAPKC
jgi:hypothetical protein